MIKEAKMAGQFNTEYSRPIDRLQITTVEEILAGARMNLPLAAEVLKKAQSKYTNSQETFQFN